MIKPADAVPLEMWGGLECTVNRVGARWFDQTAWSGHDGRSGDLELFAALGLQVIRYPVLWERHAPRTLGEIDWSWSDRRLERLRSLGLRPIAGLLHHGSGPKYTSLLDPAFPEKLATFAAAAARRYPWVADFTPINEPLTTARFSALYGHWHPHARSDRDFVRALLNQMRGVVLAMRAIREVTPGARLIQTEDCGGTFGTGPLVSQVAFEGDRRWLTWDILTGRVDGEHPLRDFLRGAGMTDGDEAFFRDHVTPPDVVGLNYYATSDRFLDHRLERYPLPLRGGNGRQCYADMEAVRAREEGIAGHEAHLMSAWDRYRLPVAVTEVHLACTREEQMRWLIESWQAAHRARSRGAAVRAVTAWALLGSFNWNSLVTRDDGHYEPGVFDTRGPAPRPTALAGVVQALATGRDVAHPAAQGEGWWRRPQRLIFGAGGRYTPLPSDLPTLLIVGSTGTLGRAFHRLCELRGLRSQLVARTEMDIADPTRVDAMLRRVRPWAVINAAGYVRVDDAEHEIDACRGANITGPVNLAAACRRHGIGLVTFSSDLVFDGSRRTPYVETDAPAPLNVYGATKAEAERRVLDLLPDALVIRTSAFFGPWDEYNFLACLFRALEDGHRFPAAADATVSPTYVPDLVNASLDLLIDGERGIWHLASAGAVTWYDFACTAAGLAGRGIETIDAVETAAVSGPAARPSYSVLGSVRGQVMRPLGDALTAYIRDARQASAATGTETP